ncbi:MAG TPA: hypothetical protein VIM90_03985 [Arenimonas sp.]|tara:strand:+ start:3914 stop:4609 length:696 start_codon:yes stop_codon:yes gene_type:complete
MSRPRFLAALLLSVLAPLSAAQDEMRILMQRSSEPPDAGEFFVFVGEYVDYQPLKIDCDNCWVFDTWHTARYRVAEWIHGVPPGPELTFDVAEHSVIVPFGHSRYALAFVERHGDELALVKYQQVPVYPTADGSFASCGPLWGDRDSTTQPQEINGPALRDIEFSPQLVVDDAGRLSEYGRNNAYDPRWHEVIGNEVLCRRGVPVAELVPAIVRETDVLSAALPELAGPDQ